MKLFKVCVAAKSVIQQHKALLLIQSSFAQTAGGSQNKSQDGFQIGGLSGPQCTGPEQRRAAELGHWRRTVNLKVWGVGVSSVR